MSIRFLLASCLALFLFACDSIQTNNNVARESKVSEKMKKIVQLETAVTKGKKMVKLETSMGDIVLEINSVAAPVSAENFLEYVKSGFYDGTIFHRVISNFMIQGGGFDEKFEQKATRATIINEAKNGLKNDVGSIAMARTSDPNSASSQFFINVKDNSFLDYPGQDGFGYAVFGKVSEGMDIVEKMRNVATGNKGPHQDVPVENVIIKKATIIEK